MSKRLATIEIHYIQNKHSSLHISKKVPQWIANQMAIRYLELLEREKQKKKSVLIKDKL